MFWEEHSFGTGVASAIYVVITVPLQMYACHINGGKMLLNDLNQPNYERIQCLLLLLPILSWPGYRQGLSS